MSVAAVTALVALMLGAGSGEARMGGVDGFDRPFSVLEALLAA